MVESERAAWDWRTGRGGMLLRLLQQMLSEMLQVLSRRQQHHQSENETKGEKTETDSKRNLHLAASCIGHFRGQGGVYRSSAQDRGQTGQRDRRLETALPPGPEDKHQH